MDCGIVERNAWFGEARRGRGGFVNVYSCTQPHVFLYLSIPKSRYIEYYFIFSLALCYSHLLFEPEAHAPSKCREQ
jgi:hypothetical protein